MQPKLLLLLACFTAVCVAGPTDTFTNLFSKRQDNATFTDADFIDPKKGGGSLLNRSGSGGEPLNVGSDCLSYSNPSEKPFHSRSSSPVEVLHTLSPQKVLQSTCRLLDCTALLPNPRASF